MANAWECPRCHVINAPHVDRCTCPCGCKPEDGGVKKDFMPKCPGQILSDETGKPLAHRVLRQVHYFDSELNRVTTRTMFHGDGE